MSGAEADEHVERLDYSKSMTIETENNWYFNAEKIWVLIPSEDTTASHVLNQKYWSCQSLFTSKFSTTETVFDRQHSD